MTHQEAAQDIYDQMKGFRVKENTHRKRCAIKAIDYALKTLGEIVFSTEPWETNSNPMMNVMDEKREFLEGVKLELEKL